MFLISVSLVIQYLDVWMAVYVTQTGRFLNHDERIDRTWPDSAWCTTQLAGCNAKQFCHSAKISHLAANFEQWSGFRQMMGKSRSAAELYQLALAEPFRGPLFVAGRDT